MVQPGRTFLPIIGAFVLAFLTMITLSVVALQESPVLAVRSPAAGEVGGSIYLQAPDSSKRLMPGVTVYARRIVDGRQSGRAETDCHGRFSIPDLAPGSYRVCWSGPGYTSDCSSAELPVESGGPVVSARPYRIYPRPGTSLVYGSLRLADGGAARFRAARFEIDQRATVRLFSDQRQIAEQEVSCRDDFVFAGLPRARYALQATYAGLQASAAVSQSETATDLILANSPPVIRAIYATAAGQGVLRRAPGATVQVRVEAADHQGDELDYRFAADQGTLVPTTEPGVVDWRLDDHSLLQTIEVLVGDQAGGFAHRRLSLSTALGVNLRGRVVDRLGEPLVGAEIDVNGVAAVSDREGRFLLSLFGDDNRFVLNIRQRGFALLSQVYHALPEARVYRLREVESFRIDPRRPVSVVSVGESAGFSLSGGTLVDPSGRLASAPLRVFLGGIDPGEAVPNRLPGDSLAIDQAGRRVALSSFGALSVAVEDDFGGSFELRAGSTAKVTVPVANHRPDSVFPDSVPLWSYDREAGVWRAVGEAARSGAAYVGEVSVLGEISAAVPISESVCLRLLVDGTLGASLPLDLRLEVPSTGQILYRQVDRQIDAIYALPASTPLDLVLLDSTGRALESTRQRFSTGPSDAACPTYPDYPYSCCTASWMLALSPASTDLETRVAELSADRKTEWR